MSPLLSIFCDFASNVCGVASLFPQVGPARTHGSRFFASIDTLNFVPGSATAQYFAHAASQHNHNQECSLLASLSPYFAGSAMKTHAPYFRFNNSFCRAARHTYSTDNVGILLRCKVDAHCCTRACSRGSALHSRPLSAPHRHVEASPRNSRSSGSVR